MTLSATRDPHGGIVLCPLRYEAKQMQAARIGAGHVIDCSGPGRDGINRWFDENGDRAKQMRWVLLIGLAGAIDPRIAPGTARIISVVIGSDGRRWTSPMAKSLEEFASTTITTSHQVIQTATQRDALRSATGAQLVDQESEAFAACAERIDAQWGIVRGISDGVSSTLPRDLERWVDETGRTRPLRVASSLMRSPGDLPRMIELARVSRIAMRAAAHLAANLIASSSDHASQK